jgi:NADH-ubiquinone oxidoreductase chain 5
MYLAILALPLFGSLAGGLAGRKIGIPGAQLITTFCVALAAALAWVAFFEVGLAGSPVSVPLTSWVDSEILKVDWTFYFDSLTVAMLIPVLTVSTLVHLYSVSYMADEPHAQRFFSYLSLFTFFMLILVAGANYLILFVGLFPSWPTLNTNKYWNNF